VPDEIWLGKQGRRLEADAATLAGQDRHSAMGVGCAQGAYEKALAYAKERRPVYQPISHFQVDRFCRSLTCI